MSVIIRLQNLPWSANALDIRQYFCGLSIPEGGVHIVGGELGDAFIAFSTDEDARQAFCRNSGKIKEVQITLLLSSRQEMQKIIDSARNPLAAFMQTPQAPIITPSVTPSSVTSAPVETHKSDRESSRDDRRESKRRSRSKSRERSRSGRSSRDRDRSYRRRDRSRSRDRRRRKSRSRDRTRSKERDRRDRSRDRKKNSDGGSRRNSDAERNQQSDGELRWEPPLKNEGQKPNPFGGLPAPFIVQPPGILQMQQRPISVPVAQSPPVTHINSPMSLPAAGAIPPKGPWSQMPNVQNQMPMRNNMDGPGLGPGGPGCPPAMGMNRMGFHGPNGGPPNGGPSNNGPNNGPNGPMNMDRGDMPPNNFNGNNRMPPAFQQNNMPHHNNGPNGNYNQNNNQRPFPPDRQDNNRMGYGRPPFNRDMNNSPCDGPEFNNFNRFNNQGMDGMKQGPMMGAPNCCVVLRPFFGGYGEVRRFFNGAFINNTGLKFVCDDNGDRTGEVYVRFVMHKGKQMALQMSGTMLRGQQVEVCHLEDELFDRFQEGIGRRPPFCPNNSFPHGNKRPPMYDNISEKPQPQIDLCVALEDLPNYAKEPNVMKMFSDCLLSSIVVIRLRRQRDTCTAAYVKFKNPEDASRVVANKSKYSFEGKPVVIRACSLEEFEEVNRQHINGSAVVELSGELPDQDDVDDEKKSPEDRFSGEPQSDCVHLRGMPFKVTERGVGDFFSDIGVVPTKIHARGSGEFFCEFANVGKAEMALEKNDSNLGNSIVTVESISRSDMEQALSSNMPHNNGGGGSNHRMNSPGLPFNNRFGFGRLGPPMGGPPGYGGHGPMGFRGPPRRGLMGSMPSCSVAMSNVPYKCSKEEIVEFFEGFGIGLGDVLRRNDNGKPTGDVLVTFGSPEEALRAVEDYNQTTLRERIVYLKIAPSDMPPFN